MRNEQAPERIERVIGQAAERRAAGAPGDALSMLDAALGLCLAGPMRRELRVGLERERALAFVALGEAKGARDALLAALDQANGEAPLADLVRAELSSVELMADEPRRARQRLGERSAERRASLLARARLALWEGATALAGETLQACEQAPGGGSELFPPSPLLRALCALWEGRAGDARMLYDGVGTAGSPWWDLLRVAILRAHWVAEGDGRYLDLALGAAEQLRFDASTQHAPGLSPAAASQHALLLSCRGELALSVRAADEALELLGGLTLPEWPRAAIVHDLAVVYRDAGRAERWRRMLDAWAELPPGCWAARMLTVTGARAEGAVDPPAREGKAGAGLAAELGLAVMEGRKAPEQALLRALTAELGAHGGAWTDTQGRPLASMGTAVGAEEPGDAEVVRLDLPAGGALTLFGVRESDALAIDLDLLGRVAVAARLLGRGEVREQKLRDALELAQAKQSQATSALERQRRGGAVAVLGGRFPQVAGRSDALRGVLDHLAALATTALPVLLEGPPGSGRRHLARALDAHLGGQPERCPVVEMALVPPEAMPSTLRRMEAAAAGAAYVVAGAEHLTPEALGWLTSRSQDPLRRARPLVTLDEGARGPVPEALREAFAVGRVRVPGLGERLEDLPSLIDALALSLGRRAEDIGTAARAILARRGWPGQVAELRQVLAAAVARAADRAVLREHFEAAAERPTASLSEGLDRGYHDAVRGFRARLLQHALVTTGGNRTRAAALLGVQRTYFMRLIKELGDASV